MDWTKFEDKLYRASVRALNGFAKQHGNEPFYGFSFDCNADYGEVLLALNSEAELAATAKRFPAYSPQQVESRLRWNSGDWKYPGFNLDGDLGAQWEKAWGSMQEKIQNAALDLDDEECDEMSEIFLESVCRVLLRMEREGVFRCLKLEPHFKALVTDHDEPLEDSWERLDVVRKSMSTGGHR